MFTTEMQKIGNYLLVRLSGSPQNDEIIPWKNEILSMIENGQDRIAFDIGNVSPIPISMVYLLLDIRSHILSSSRETFILINTPPDFLLILQVAQVHSLFEFYPSIDDVLKKSEILPIPDPVVQEISKPIIYEIPQKEASS